MITNRFIFGGIEKLLLDVFENKKNLSIHYDLLTLISEKNDALIKKISLLGVGYYTLGLENYSSINRQLYHYKGLYEFVKKNHYDVVHINISSYVRVLDMFVLKMAGVKTRIIHSHSSDVKDSFTRRILRPMRNLYDFFATDFLACSDNAAKYLFSRKIYNEKKYIIINNGIEVKKYLYSNTERKRIRNSLDIQEDVLVFGHVGRLTEAKNHMFLLETYSELVKLWPRSKLLLVGDGELKKDIEEKINSLGIKNSVIMYGTSSDIPALLSAMDIFLFPSKWEGLGISVVEAQCNGLPCYISENVPKTAIITSNVSQYNISKGAEWWAKNILNKKNQRVNETRKIVEAAYDIRQTVHLLESIYTRN